MRGLLVDTGPLYALAIPSDQYHMRARAQQQRLTLERLSVCVLYPVVAETYTLILRRVSPSVAHRWIRDLHERTSLLNPTPADYQDAVELLERYPDQTISLFDALLAVLGQDLGMDLWTFDSHFDTLRASVWRPTLL